MQTLTRFLRQLVPFLALAICLASRPAVGDETSGDDVAETAESILAKNCYKCHSKKKSGRLDASSLQALLVGGKRGPAISPGNADASRLIQLVLPDAKPHMPPGKKQLSERQISILRTWVDQMPAAQPAPIATSEAASVAADSSHAADATQDTSAWLPPQGVDPTTVIDLWIQSGYQQRGVSPTAECSDAEFVRRLYLDLVARIPSLSETRQFLSATNSGKRDDLIQQLLDSDEFAERMADAFDTMLMGRNERRLADRASKGWHDYLRNAFGENRPWNLVAREVLLARGESTERGHIWFLHERNNKHQDIAESIAKAFFGIDIACAQCHDHPLAGEIQQAHYWGLVSFFNRSRNADAKNGFAVAESAIGGFNDYANALQGTTNQAVLTFLQRGVVPEQRPDPEQKQEESDELYRTIENEPRVPLFSRREKFVDEVLDLHPLLARAMVNRLWAMLVGRGIVHPPESMDSSHPPSHPELLQWLSTDFQQHGYDVKRVVRAIVRSQAYQLQATSLASVEPDSFAYGLEKPMTAEAFLGSLMVALRVESHDMQQVASIFRKAFPEILPKNHLSNLKQTLMLSNNDALQQLFLNASSKWDTDQLDTNLVADLFLQIYGRLPAADERDAVEQYLAQRTDRRQDALAHVLWAMVCSAEFRFNH